MRTIEKHPRHMADDGSLLLTCASMRVSCPGKKEKENRKPDLVTNNHTRWALPLSVSVSLPSLAVSASFFPWTGGGSRSYLVSLLEYIRVVRGNKVGPFWPRIGMREKKERQPGKERQALPSATQAFLSHCFLNWRERHRTNENKREIHCGGTETKIRPDT